MKRRRGWLRKSCGLDNSVVPVTVLTELTNSMDLSLSSEAGSHSAAQEFPNSLMKPQGSLPFSKEPCIGSSPELDELNPSSPFSLSNTHFHYTGWARLN
jgi:hypothetical protein